MATVLISLVVGVAAGVLSGLFGIGGGIVIVPALILFLGFTQHKAQGTSLAALLLPVGALGAWKYYQDKNVDFGSAIPIALGLLAGALAGANIASSLDPVTMRKVFSVFLVGIAIYLWTKK
ncbi:MAG: sulfite exporter TauE/SafE family protein [Fimbriimonadaceae bacterium]|nr:MAG: sulfite exporter TauE/SafE family protein [Fimbriimonadaceae bacterium]